MSESDLPDLPYPDDDALSSRRSFSHRSLSRKFSFGLLGGDKEAFRTVVINSPPDNHAFPDNSIRTAKYTWISLVPKAIFEQFRRVANFYFLTVACVTFIPNVSPSSPITAVLPLVVVVGFGLARDVWEDFGRKRADSKSNGTICTVLKNDQHSSSTLDKHSDIDAYLVRHQLDPTIHTAVKRSEIRVGDLVLVRKGETFPADLVLLYTSNEAGIGYVSTANLDGESNLKRRLIPVDAKDTISTVSDLGSFEAKIIAQNPTPLLHLFDASLLVKKLTPCPLDESNLLLRGCVLRNTNFIYGVAVYTGQESKVALNMRDPPSKLGGIESMLNIVVVCLFLALMILVIIASTVSGIYQTREGEGRQWYMGSKGDISGIRQGFRSIATYIILFHTFIPISLFVTLEFVRVFQGWFMKADPKMKSKGIRVNVKANNLNDTLGNVQHILTDKTGTLTENVMKYVACSAGPEIYDSRINGTIIQSEVAAGNTSVKRLVLAMGLCHSVVPERKSEDDVDISAISKTEATPTEYDLEYQGQSPDEVALVSSAREFGVELRERQLDRIRIREFSAEESDYIQLAELEFSSERKRMSVIFRCPDGRIRMFTKGADSVMLELLEPGPYTSKLQEQIDIFALDGLRTLVYGERDLSEEQYKEWRLRYEAACNLMSGRKEAQASVAAEAERGLHYIGSTAVEDQLQDKVPETIEFLRQAGISMWVLTGDKRETAENIGYSARLLQREMNVIHIEVSSAVECKQALEDIRQGNEIALETSPSQSRETVNRSNEELSSWNQKDTTQSNGNAALSSQSRGTFSKRHSRRLSSSVIGGAAIAIIIDGASLEHATSEELASSFLALTAKCSTVICCRVTPLQKAKMVKLVRGIENTTTLAIGDGGNDVSMIQEAHVGVGIVGKEGSQAARAADYSMAEFKHLKRLTTVHGRYSYVRTCGVINLSFYKNVFFTLTQVFFQIFAFWSGTTYHEQWMVTFFNALLTLFPPFFYGIFEKDLDERTLSKYPRVYQTNWNNRLFSIKKVAEFLLISSLWHALSTFFGVYFGIGSHIPFADGRDGGFYFSGLAMTIIVLSVVIVKFVLLSHLFNVIVIGGFLFSFGIVFGLVPILVVLFHALEFEGLLSMLLRSPAFWLTWVISASVAFIPDFVILAVRATRKSSGVVPRLQKWEKSAAGRSKGRAPL
eukprot:Plantae.Rhodophyta-Hildenbrandia_rubra.ctg3400.p1 GENE.Plantae.Rhodophyta-Hildenbrandia_rubra.ctg3400~~Plantae.Rhodophyta-Hildenbrandia_rubra.ctg3400.p1  ORF type:complete len:1183 (+),score=168.28 Plantae.Rhodophyta-Hildenbrandia_rubra.ctg3400:1027-4575(+)